MLRDSMARAQREANYARDGGVSRRRTTGMRARVVAAVWGLSLVLQACATNAPQSAPDQRAAIRQMASETLAQLYRSDPGAQSRVRTAAGYAVFSDVGMKMGYGGAVHGGGLAVNNATRQDVFMKMIELQPGYGFGIENFRNVFIFDTPAALSDFVNSGWEFGANAMAAVQNGTRGGGAAGAVLVAPGVTMYQFTQQGAIAGVSVTGAKYFKDDTLN
jgi:lipid-binding SYLF domain-containing protein